MATSKLADFAKLLVTKRHCDMFMLRVAWTLGLSSLSGSPRMAAISPPVRSADASRALALCALLRVRSCACTWSWWLLLSFAFCGEPAASQDSQKAEQSITHNEVRISGRRLMFSPGRRDIGCGDQSTLVAIAVLIAGDSGGGVAIAELAAANVVAGVGAELRAVENFEETASANLARDGGEGVLRGGGAGCGVLRGVGDAGAGTAVGVANEDAAGFVHRDVVEVEQIAARIAAAAVPYAATLHGIGGRGVNSGPNAAGVVGEGDAEMPDAGEVGGMRVAGGLRAQESEGGAGAVAAHYLGEPRVPSAEGSPGVFGFRPVQSAIGG